MKYFYAIMIFLFLGGCATSNDSKYLDIINEQRLEIANLKGQIEVLTKNNAQLSQQLLSNQTVPVTNVQQADTSKATKAIGRCQAVTSSGTQCKKNAEAGSNYC